MYLYTLRLARHATYAYNRRARVADGNFYGKLQRIVISQAWEYQCAFISIITTSKRTGAWEPTKDITALRTRATGEFRMRRCFPDGKKIVQDKMTVQYAYRGLLAFSFERDRSCVLLAAAIVWSCFPSRVHLRRASKLSPSSNAIVLITFLIFPHCRRSYNYGGEERFPASLSLAALAQLEQ